MLKEVLQEEINDLFINELKEKQKNTEHPWRKQEFWRRKKEGKIKYFIVLILEIKI